MPHASSIVAQILRYRRDRNRSLIGSAWNVGSDDEGLAIQELFAATLDEPVVGWKLGGLDAASRERLGLQRPFIGRVFESTLYISPANLSDRWSASGCYLEAELAFRMTASLAPRDAPYERSEVLAAIGSVHAAFEIVDCTLGEVKGQAGLNVLADNGGCGGLVVGTALENWRDVNYGALEVSLTIGDEVNVRSKVMATRDELVDRICWLANFLSGRGIELAAGQFIATGTWAGMHRLQPGMTADANFSSDDIELTVAAFIAQATK